MIYRRILKGKDLPKHGSRASETLAKIDGPNFNFSSKDGYRNDLSPEADENQAALQFLQKDIEEDALKKLKAYCSPSLLEEIRYLRCLFLVRIGEKENVENLDKASLRSGLLQAAEHGLRNCLRQLQVNFEVSSIQEKIKTERQKTITVNTELIESLNSNLTQIFEKLQISKDEVKGLYANTEENICYADKQTQTLSQMLRCRLNIGRVSRKHGFVINSFYVLRESLINIKKFAEGLFSGIEKGEESEQKGSFRLPEMYGGGASAFSSQSSAPVGKGKQAPPPKAAAPVKAGGKPIVDPSEELSAAAEQERRKQEQIAAEKARIEVESQPRRQHPHMLLWLMTKVEIVSILLQQNRIEDVTDAISVTKLECMAIKDQLFLRKLEEIDFMVLVKGGKVAEAL